MGAARIDPGHPLRGMERGRDRGGLLCSCYARSRKTLVGHAQWETTQPAHKGDKREERWSSDVSLVRRPPRPAMGTLPRGEKKASLEESFDSSEGLQLAIPLNLARGQSFLVPLEYGGPRDEAVKRSALCVANPYHVVFPVKYPKSLLDEVVTTIIQETAARSRTVSDRDGSDWDGQESHPSALQWIRSGSRPDCADIQEHHCARDFSPKACCKRVLWGAEFWNDGYYFATVGERETGRLSNGMAAARATSGTSPAVANFLVL